MSLLGRKAESGKQKVEESTLALAESGYVDLPRPEKRLRRTKQGKRPMKVLSQNMFCISKYVCVQFYLSVFHVNDLLYSSNGCKQLTMINFINQINFITHQVVVLLI
jgi:hypothetical protein